MSKTLILVRHSKAEISDSSSDDFDRSLTTEGKSESLKMAIFLQHAGIVPDFILSSSAFRAYETAMTFAEIFKTAEKNVLSTRILYYASAKKILEQIYDLPERINSLLIVAHNPGISDLSRRLSAGRSFFMDNTQVTFLEYEIDRWKKIENIEPSDFKSFSVKGIDQTFRSKIPE
jgi:phosphohistidine phosphatase